MSEPFHIRDAFCDPALRALWNWLAPYAGAGPIQPKRKAEAA